MLRTRTAQISLVALALLPSARLGAQTCGGFPSLRARHLRVGAEAASYTHATTLGVSVAAGSGVFGVVGAGRTRDAALDASATDLKFEAGVEVALNRTHRVFLCPLATYSRSTGPDDFLLSQQNYRYTDRGLQIGLAAVAVRAHHLTIVATGALRASALTTSRTGWPDVKDTYWLWSFGVGLSINEVLTVRPTVSIPTGFVPPGSPSDYAVPFGREEGEVSLGIAIGFTFGARPGRP